MFTEADNEINNGPSAEALAAFEAVRKRAYLGNEGMIGLTPTDKAGFFDALMKERLLEFGGEGILLPDGKKSIGDKAYRTALMEAILILPPSPNIILLVQVKSCSQFSNLFWWLVPDCNRILDIRLQNTNKIFLYFFPSVFFRAPANCLIPFKFPQIQVRRGSSFSLSYLLSKRII